MYIVKRYSYVASYDFSMSNMHMIAFVISCLIHFIEVICYSYITSRSRISLLLHETEGEAQGRVLITIISYECL